ncbi:MAG: hypothetical protein AAGG53_10075 [Cyanobacteria bacterium P01_H01_bin.152]
MAGVLMLPDKKEALITGGVEAGIEALKLVPGVGILIESLRKYRESIEEQQQREFIQKILERLEYVERNLDWYKTEDGNRFARKVIATALNAEYVDKLDFIANLFVNGATLENSEAERFKYVEMVRLLSRPALQVLVKIVQILPEHKGISVRNLAAEIGWEPALVDACILELHAVGAISQKWFGDAENPERRTLNNTPVITEFTKSFAKIVSLPAS